MVSFPRVRPLALPLLAAALALTGLAPLWGQNTASAPTVQVDKTPWLYKGSDIPHDPEWRFGTLPNGLRYAVRRNGVPPVRSRSACAWTSARCMSVNPKWAMRI